MGVDSKKTGEQNDALERPVSVWTRACSVAVGLTGVLSSDCMEDVEELRVDGVNSSSDASDDVRDTDDRGVSGSTSSHLRLWPANDSSASSEDSFSALAASLTSAFGRGGTESSAKAVCHLPSTIGSNASAACGLLPYQR